MIQYSGINPYYAGKKKWPAAVNPDQRDISETWSGQVKTFYNLHLLNVLDYVGAACMHKFDPVWIKSLQ